MPLSFKSYECLVLFTVLNFPDQVVIGIISFNKARNRCIESGEIIELHKGLSDLFQKLRRQSLGESDGILLDVAGLGYYLD